MMEIKGGHRAYMKIARSQSELKEGDIKRRLRREIMETFLTENHCSNKENMKGKYKNNFAQRE